ncbi:MAG: hypothetical protein K2X35_22035 [Bryobacteraceae bacterium]|nr:hypothetical protein [Bryobacteraceae bacterium]
MLAWQTAIETLEAATRRLNSTGLEDAAELERAVEQRHRALWLLNSCAGECPSAMQPRLQEVHRQGELAAARIRDQRNRVIAEIGTLSQIRRGLETQIGPRASFLDCNG